MRGLDKKLKKQRWANRRASLKNLSEKFNKIKPWLREKIAASQLASKNILMILNRKLLRSSTSDVNWPGQVFIK
jgi:hypothetical protein